MPMTGASAMPTTAEITQELRRLLRPNLPSRPFLCHGSPEGCEVILVGINPGTTTPFWNVWSDSGCDKDAWLREYIAREGRLKPTRKRIEIIANTLAPEIRTLELNLYPYSSAREADLPAELRDRRVFDYVMTLADPRLLFVYGRTPTDELAAVLGCSIPEKQYTRVTHQGRSFEVYSDKHLSYQWSDAGVRQLAQVFKDRVLAVR
jgi:hypothetical protein